MAKTNRNHNPQSIVLRLIQDGVHESRWTFIKDDYRGGGGQVGNIMKWRLRGSLPLETCPLKGHWWTWLSICLETMLAFQKVIPLGSMMLLKLALLNCQEEASIKRSCTTLVAKRDETIMWDSALLEADPNRDVNPLLFEVSLPSEVPIQQAEDVLVDIQITRWGFHRALTHKELMIACPYYCAERNVRVKKLPPALLFPLGLVKVRERIWNHLGM